MSTEVQKTAILAWMDARIDDFLAELPAATPVAISAEGRIFAEGANVARTMPIGPYSPDTSPIPAPGRVDP